MEYKYTRKFEGKPSNIFNSLHELPFSFRFFDFFYKAPKGRATSIQQGLCLEGYHHATKGYT